MTPYRPGPTQPLSVLKLEPLRRLARIGNRYHVAKGNQTLCGRAGIASVSVLRVAASNPKAPICGNCAAIIAHEAEKARELACDKPAKWARIGEAKWATQTRFGRISIHLALGRWTIVSNCKAINAMIRQRAIAGKVFECSLDAMQACDAVISEERRRARAALKSA